MCIPFCSPIRIPCTSREESRLRKSAAYEFCETWCSPHNDTVGRENAHQGVFSISKFMFCSFSRNLRPFFVFCFRLSRRNERISFHHEHSSSLARWKWYRHDERINLPNLMLRQVPFASPRKIKQNWNFSRVDTDNFLFFLFRRSPSTRVFEGSLISYKSFILNCVHFVFLLCRSARLLLSCHCCRRNFPAKSLSLNSQRLFILRYSCALRSRCLLIIKAWRKDFLLIFRSAFFANSFFLAEL